MNQTYQLENATHRLDLEHQLATLHRERGCAGGEARRQIEARIVALETALAAETRGAA